MKKDMKKVSQRKNRLLLLPLVIILFLYLFLNILFSQNISPLYFQLIKDDKKATVEFLKKIRKLSLFKNELRKYKALYGQEIEEEVFSEEKELKETIKKFEKILEKNPNSRDALYNLSLLYHQLGDKKKAQDYLQKAKAIDPEIK